MNEADAKRRAPAALILEPDAAAAMGASSSQNAQKKDMQSKSASARQERARAPRAAEPASVEITEDVFDAATAPVDAVTPQPRRSFPFGAVLLAALSLLFSLWLAQAVTDLVMSLLAVRPELGWAAAAIAGIALLAFIGVIAREMLALSRLAANTGLQKTAADAHAANDAASARKVIDGLSRITDATADTKSRAAFDMADRQFLSARDLIELAEATLVAPLDDRARRAVIDAAKRVSVVTAVSPRAVVDIGYVLFENARLIRAVAAIYGCRPGFLGFLRLARATLAHLAVTGVVAMGDTLVQQIVGHGLAARISARLGEGVLNGVMTARIGFAAMDVARPLPFIARARPGVQAALGEIAGGTKPSLPSGQ
ncbi:MAG: TIGR01620 family protein [Rhizobiaceae bacterium]|jgi:putative membrane protein|nr:TIGR01620 family protein [Rhizobiaceae bacterium]